MWVYSLTKSLWCHSLLSPTHCLFLPYNQKQHTMNIETLIDPTTVQGAGSNLYALIRVDQDDAEDTTISLWRADSEDHLYDQVAEEYYDGEDPEDFMGPNFDEEIWGLLWLPKFIGTVK